MYGKLRDGSAKRAAGHSVCGRLRLPALSLSAVLLLAVAALAGCGESSSHSASSPSSSALAGAAAVSQPGAVPHGDVLALVDGRQVTRASYTHWLAVERALGASSGTAGHRALGFLISSDWVLAEAVARGVSASEAEVRQRVAQLERQSFPKAGAFAQFLATSHQSEADLRERVKIEMLESRIAAKVAAAKSASRRRALLTSFQQSFQRRWKSRTTCAAGYVMEDCSEYRGKPENLSASVSPSRAASTPSSSSAASSAARSAAASSGGASGEVYSAPGALSITSPAFGRNGAIPTRYTCDGSNISPPLEWQHVPAKAAALVLFIIDDTPKGPASGIRWVVGDIEPGAKGVAAGQTPAGGIVGSDTQGHGVYGGICPGRGKTSSVQFVLYALSKKIPLAPGFKATTAEREYGAGKLLLGSAAVTYAVYHRP